MTIGVVMVVVVVVVDGEEFLTFVIITNKMTFYVKTSYGRDNQD